MTAKEREGDPAEAINYFAVLGVGEDASQQDIEARYQALSEYLASTDIPAGLREWADCQAALVDEAYAVLADPEQRAAFRTGRVTAAPGPAPVAAEQPGERAPAAEEPRRRAAEAAPPKAPRAPAPGRGLSIQLPGGLGPRHVALGVAIGLVALVAVVLLTTGLPGGGGGGDAPTAAEEEQLIPLDTERVAELMASVQQDPNNPETLFELGESFFQAGEWQAAIDWFTKLVAIDPNNVHARTDIGTSNFNLGNTEEAKAAWLAALDLAPEDVQLHYNMGFLYANAEPRDLDAAKKEWQLVMDLAPGSDLANIVQVHLEGLSAETPAEPTPTPTP